MAGVSDKGSNLFGDSFSILKTPVEPRPKPGASTLNFQGRPAPAPTRAPAPTPAPGPTPTPAPTPNTGTGTSTGTGTGGTSNTASTNPQTGQPGPSRPPVTQPRNGPLFPPYNFAHQDLWTRTDNLIQESLSREYEAEQRRIENDRVVRAREYDPSPSPTPSVSTDEGHDPADFWHEDQVALNVILNARNEYSLMPSTWRMSLKGIPLPEGLFYTKTKNTATRPRIYAHTDSLEFRGMLVYPITLHYLTNVV